MVLSGRLTASRRYPLVGAIEPFVGNGVRWLTTPGTVSAAMLGSRQHASRVAAEHAEAQLAHMHMHG